MLRPTDDVFNWDELIDEKRAHVSTSIFVDEQIYALEVERIFNRSWLYLGHATEIPNPGDFVTRRMGDDLVILIRGDDGKPRAFLNGCRHRGSLITKLDSGNCDHFVCPYHGWTYTNAGELVTTSYDDFYQGKLDFAANGLREVAQLDSHGQLIFATWDAGAPSLSDYLGDMKWYLDIYFNRTPGGMEVLAPPQRWIVNTNWKLGALNFGTDNQHLHPTHMGPTALGILGAPVNEVVAALGSSYQVSMDGGHGCVNTTLPHDDLPYTGLPKELIPLYEQTLNPEQLTILRRNVVTVGNVFPYLAWIQVALDTERKGKGIAAGTLRLWQPIGPHQIELTSWYLAEKEAPEEHKQAVLTEGLRSFGMSGMFEEDDIDIWSSIVTAGKGSIARTGTMNFETALNFKPVDDFPGPGRAYYPMLPECEQFNLLKHWKQVISRR